MCIVEDVPKSGKLGADAKVRIGIVAVVPSTGTVVYDGASLTHSPASLARVPSLTSRPPPAEFDDTLMRAELETRMLHLQPSELLLQKELSGKTESMVKYLARQYACVPFLLTSLSSPSLRS